MKGDDALKLQYKRIVVKVGTNVLTRDDGFLDQAIIDDLVSQITMLKQQGVQVILVSSGAMGAGRSLIQLASDSADVVQRQVLAAVGQVKLMSVYAEHFARHHYICAQVLATKEDFRDRHHYLNMKNCFTALLRDDIVPIVNENDVVSVSELMFTDNDELAALIASMMDVEALIILTNVEGVLRGSDGVLLRTVDANASVEDHVSPAKSLFGRGGMLTKCKIARTLALLGIVTHIANGRTQNTLLAILQGKAPGTTFLPKKRTSSMKKWIAYARGSERGMVSIDEGAVRALSSKDKAVSLLPVGITHVEGEFRKGDIIRIKNAKGDDIGFGIAQYDADRVQAWKGLPGKKTFIHYDYLYLTL